MKAFTFTLLSIASCCFACQQKEASPFQQRFTFEQVRAIAAEYGMEHEIAETETAFLYYSTEQLKAEFLRRKEIKDYEREEAIYFQKTADVRTMQDDVDLTNALPAFRRRSVEVRGGEEAYKAWVAEQVGVDWHIYRNKDGVLKFVAADIDPDGEDIFGERIDNKPRK